MPPTNTFEFRNDTGVALQLRFVTHDGDRGTMEFPPGAKADVMSNTVAVKAPVDVAVRPFGNDKLFSTRYVKTVRAFSSSNGRVRIHRIRRPPSVGRPLLVGLTVLVTLWTVLMLRRVYASS